MGARLAVGSPASVFTEYLRNLEPFRTSGSFYGVLNPKSLSEPLNGCGRLSEPYFTPYAESVSKGTISYVIYSYETPIAWCVDGQWIVSDVKYSPTTSQHQNTIKVALAEF